MAVEQGGGVDEPHPLTARHGVGDNAVDRRGAAARVRGVGDLQVRGRRENPGGDLGPGGGDLVQVSAHVSRHGPLVARLEAIVLAELDDHGRHVDALEARERPGLEDLAAHALVHEVEAKMLGEKRRPRARRVLRPEALRDRVAEHEQRGPRGDRNRRGTVRDHGAHLAGHQARQPHAHPLRLAEPREGQDGGIRVGEVQGEEAVPVGEERAQVPPADVGVDGVGPPRLDARVPRHVGQDGDGGGRDRPRAKLERDLACAGLQLDGHARRTGGHLPVEPRVPGANAAQRAQLRGREARRAHPAVSGVDDVDRPVKELRRGRDEPARHPRYSPSRTGS